MNQEEKVIAIGKVCGLQTPPGGVFGAQWVYPEYFTDLNAIHKAEKSFWQEPYSTDGTLHIWGINLSNIVSGRLDTYPQWHYILSANASQRAAAFGKTLNLF